MKYQEDPMPGMPEWVKIGVRGLVWSEEEAVATHYDRNAEPITVWEPKVGERVIGWDDEDTTIILGTFVEAYESHQYKIVSRKERSYLCDHIARIHTGLHYGMSIDEIKANTDWI